MTASNDEQHVFTVPELAKRWKLHRHTLATMIADGHLAAIKIGRRFRVRLDEVQRIEREGAPTKKVG